MAKLESSKGVMFVNIATGDPVFAPKGLFIRPSAPATDAVLSYPSPKATYIAKMRLAKDEYGDLADHVLEVKQGRAHAKLLAKSRSEFPHILWVDDHTIAYSVWDKYQVPSLYVADVKTGSRKSLYSNPKMGDLLPVGYWAPGKRLLVQMSSEPLIRRPAWESIWSIDMNGHALRLATLYEDPRPAAPPRPGSAPAPAGVPARAPAPAVPKGRP